MLLHDLVTLTLTLSSKNRKNENRKEKKNKLSLLLLSLILGFITACKLYIKMKMRETAVEEQIQWVLLYVQGESADVWKENILEDLEEGELEYKSVEEFLAVIKKEFGGEEEELVKVAELKRLEQGERTIEKFV